MQNVQLKFDNTSQNLAALKWASQTVQGTVIEQTGHFFILTSRATIMMGDDTVGSIAASSAQLVEVQAQEGTSLTIICGATAEIWSANGVASGETSETTSDLPNWFKDGRIGFERQNTVFDPRVPIWFYVEGGLSFGRGGS